MKPVWTVAGYGLFFVALNWPVLGLVNRIEPRICGMPFLLAWCLLWSVAASLFHAVRLLSVTSDPAPPDGDDAEGAG